MIYFQSQVDAIVKAKDDQIKMLQAEVDLERRRANAAVDNLLYAAGSNRITPSVSEPRPKFEDLLAKVSSGLASIGTEVEIKEDENVGS